ncbi:MAG: hypothetical protein QNK04_03810 [Myxococcota bacterium]|nr:hypothetical protein [Myxococcota bacterium]
MPEPGGTRRPGVLLLLLPVAWVLAASGLWWRWGWFAGASTPPEWIGVAARVAAITVGGAATLLLVRRLTRTGLDPRPGPDLPAVLACAFAGLAVGTAFDALGTPLFWVGSVFADVFVLALAVWSCAAARRPTTTRSTARLVVANLVATLLLGELALAAYARIRPHPLLASGSDPVRRMDALRLSPGEPYFGFPANSGGYYDVEFTRGGPNTLVVAVLADSFGVGVVPYRFNFVTVAEDLLRERLGHRYERIELQNFAVSGVGLNEQAFLLEREVLRWRPDRVVLTVFVGNDIHVDPRFGETEARDRRSLLRWRIWGVPGSLWLLAKEGARATPATGMARSGEAAPEHVRDPARESPTYRPETFLRLESRRFEVCDPDSPDTEAAYQALFRGLAHFHERLGDRLLVLVVPDEFQVNDALHAELVARAPQRAAWPRDRPQQRIAGFCRRQGIACLDLLPALRHAERRARTYHLRDTHWNARGNAVAGRALAGALAEGLGAATSPPAASSP